MKLTSANYLTHLAASLLPLALVLPSIGHDSGNQRLVEPRIDPTLPAYSQLEEGFGRLSLRFEVNGGQADPQVRFLCRAAGYTLFVRSADAVMSLPESLLMIHFAGAEANPQIEGVDVLPGTTNYFLGNDPPQWRTNIPSYGKVRYRGIYPGIDLVYRGNGRHVEYDFLVAPGADAGLIRISFEGARKIEVNERGDLVLDTASGSVIQRKPRIWQQLGEARKEISGSYALLGPKRVAFAVGIHDPELPLVIDPELVYATYLGGPNSDQIGALAVGQQGDVYVAGTTDGRFPVTPGAPQGLVLGSFDVFVARLNAAGSALVYATYLGSSSQDFASAIAVDTEGNAYITGVTGYDHASRDFPTTPGAFQTTAGGNADAFVTKLNPAGTALVYSTYLVGPGPEGSGGVLGAGIAIDSAGSAYVTGSRGQCSSPFPITPGVFRAPPGWCYGYLTKLNPSGTGLVFSTDVGGQHIALDPAGNVYLAGYVGGRFSTSSSFPTTPGAFRTTCRRADYDSTGDAFIAKIDRSGGSLIYSTCFAGDINDLAVDAGGNAYVTGTTISADFTTTPGALRANGNPDCDADAYANTLGRVTGSCEFFVTKLNPSGTGLVYSTYLAPNSPGQGVPRIALDSSGNAYVAGFVYPPDDFPTTPGSFPAAPNWTAFLAKLNSTGSALIDSTRLPSGPATQTLAVSADRSAYLAGWTYQQDRVFATPGAFQTSFGGANGDGFITKVRLRDSAIVPAFDLSGVVNAASFQPGPIAPGELVTIFGSAFGSSQLTTLQLDREGRLESVLAGTRVLFDGIPSPMIYVFENHLTAVVPYAISQRTSTQVQIEYLGNKSGPVTLPVASAAPGIFTLNSSGTGQGAIVNADQSTLGDLKVNSPGNPARIGSVISVYATGGGQTSPPGVDGNVPATVLPSPVLPVEARIGSVKAEVVSATAAPGIVSGVLQLNIRIPAGIPPGDAVPVVLLIGETSTQAGVTMAVR